MIGKLERKNHFFAKSVISRRFLLNFRQSLRFPLSIVGCLFFLFVACRVSVVKCCLSIVFCPSIGDFAGSLLLVVGSGVGCKVLTVYSMSVYFLLTVYR